ncbi:MAG TPA: metal-dependent hydrolase [Methanotrichaceae archaeon]|nr:metal-dependent hydrolase [Methanotrichaceae archaeon]
MLSEHLVYSLAIGLAFGAVYQRFTGRNYWWIIVASAFVPDMDLIADSALKMFGITVLVFGAPIDHGHFHNILVMLFYAVVVAFLLHPLGIRLIDSFIFALVGFAAHMFEDALVANPAYPFLYPLTIRRFGIGFFHYHADIFAVADREVLIAGIILVMIALAMRRALAGDAATKRSPK